VSETGAVLLPRRARRRFWQEHMDAQRRFRSEKSAAHSFSQKSFVVAILGAAILALLVIATKDLGAIIRVIGAMVLFFAFYMYIRPNAFTESRRRLSARVLSWMPLYSDEAVLLHSYHRREFKAARIANKIVLAALVLLMLGLPWASLRTLEDIARVYIAPASIVAVIASCAVSFLVVTMPFVREHRQSTFKMRSGTNVLSADAMAYIVELVYPFAILIATNTILGLIQRAAGALARDIEWIARVPLFLWNLYIVVAAADAAVKVCLPIFIFMSPKRRGIAIGTSVAGVLIGIAVGGYAVDFVLPVVFSLLLGEGRLRRDQPVRMSLSHVSAAVISGCSSVAVSALVALGGTESALHMGVFVGLVCGQILDAVIGRHHEKGKRMRQPATTHLSQ
jgi:hypothetical protein